MRLTLDALAVIDAIDRKGSFAAAAETLHRVPSAVTYTIQKLEQELDVALFDRSGHRAKLTPAGQELLREGRTLLDAAWALEARVKHVAHGWEPELRIAVGDLVCINGFMPLIHEFDLLGSGTRLRFSREGFGGSWDALYTGRVDLSIGAPDEAPPLGTFKHVPLGDLVLLFAIPPTHPLALLGRPLEMNEIRQFRAVSVADTSRSLQARTSMLLTGQPTLTVPDHETKIQAQLAGLGVGFVPQPLVQPFLDSGELVAIPVNGMSRNARLHTAWSSKSTGNALKWFIEQLSRPDVIRALGCTPCIQP
ncbi:LysR family transcriptional regulator [Burkholderiaceae bacterium DAT-1]|nr:LysR family transcriptional regulator [Burkholderiaceae bacterium DAT-1]